MAPSPPMRWRWYRNRQSRRRWKKQSRSASRARTSALERPIAGLRIAVQLLADIGIGILADITAIGIDRRRATVRLRRRVEEKAGHRGIVGRLTAMADDLLLDARERRISRGKAKARGHADGGDGDPADFHNALLLRAA